MAGKIIRESLETRDLAAAQSRLRDFLKKAPRAGQADEKQNAVFYKSVSADASRFINQTTPKEKITEAIRKFLEGGAPLNAQIARMVLEEFEAMSATREDYGLTERERKVLELMVNGLIKKEIAGELSLSYHTIDTHLRNIYQKLHVHTRAGAVVKAVQERLF